MSGEKLGHQVQSWIILVYTFVLEATVVATDHDLLTFFSGERYTALWALLLVNYVGYVKKTNSDLPTHPIQPWVGNGKHVYFL